MTRENHDPDELHDRLVDIGKGEQREFAPWVIEQLSHPVDFVRAAALRTLAFYWRLPEFRDVAAACLREDPSDEVREVAAMCLGGYGYLAFSVDEMALLVDKALSSDEPDTV